MDSNGAAENHTTVATDKLLHPITDLTLGSKIHGTVTGFSPFGVFVKINYDIKENQKPG